MSDDRKPTVPEVLPFARAYVAKPENGVGGNLHIVLSDENLDNDCVRFCRDQAAERGDADGFALANLLLRMSKTQRKRIARECWRAADGTLIG